MTTKQDQKKLDKFVADMAGVLKPLVEDIEDGPAVTQNHYGRYLHILLMNDETTMRKVVALALLAAGANTQGVAAAARNAW